MGDVRACVREDDPVGLAALAVSALGIGSRRRGALSVMWVEGYIGRPWPYHAALLWALVLNAASASFTTLGLLLRLVQQRRTPRAPGHP